ncbi:MAG TPA: uracil-DNA glycosylase [Terriglobales bacterium]|nr:uracil-DNA glycosylase [Terriglobales bacterium]
MPLDPVLVARLQYYREMGIDSFYRRSNAPTAIACAPAESAAAPSPQDYTAHALPADKPAALQIVRNEIGDCTRCRLHKQRTNIVFGVGNVDADIVFVGEGPGADEDASGEPFVGRGGQLLNNMINAMGLKREDVYIANVVKCRPPGNRTPERDECDTCSPFLLKQIEVVQPKIIVALGAVAAKNLLQMNDTMLNLRGHIYDFRTTKLVVTYHPAYLLRDPRQKGEAWKDLQMVMKYLGMTPPKPTAKS